MSAVHLGVKHYFKIYQGLLGTLALNLIINQLPR